MTTTKELRERFIQLSNYSEFCLNDIKSSIVNIDGILNEFQRSQTIESINKLETLLSQNNEKTREDNELFDANINKLNNQITECKYEILFDKKQEMEMKKQMSVRTLKSWFKDDLISTNDQL